MSLDRFIEAQEYSYTAALEEIRTGRKRSHWMWYVFPQMKGLGFSSTAQYYGIRDRKEAMSYLDHTVLGVRLREISSVLLTLESSDPSEVFGYPDDLKLKSSMTLFYLVSREKLFMSVLEKFFCGEIDEKTVELLGNEIE